MRLSVKVVAVVMALIMIVNVFGFGYFTVKASAEVITAVCIGLTVGVLSSFIGWELGELLRTITDPRLKDNLSDLYNSYTNYNAVSNGELIQIVPDMYGNGYFFQPADGLPDGALELAQFLSDYFNSHGGAEYFLDMFSATGQLPNVDGATGATLSAEDYKNLKNKAINAFAAYLKLKGDDALSETSGFSSVPFDFVGPMPGFTFPTSTGYASYNSYDYCIDTPYSHPVDFWHTKEEIPIITGKNPVCTSDGHWIIHKILSGYGCGCYVLYNNDIYFKCLCPPSSFYNDSMSIRNPFGDYHFASEFTNADGRLLTDDGCNSLSGLMCGWYIIINPNAPMIPTNVKSDDLTTTSGGGSVSLPRTDEEDTIGRLMQAGILNPNSSLTLDQNGNIVAADGIDLSKLEALLNNISNSQIKFSDIQGYLQAIQTACQGTDLDMDAVMSILSAIQQNIVTPQDLQNAIAGIKDYSADLKGIKDKIKDYSGSLGDIKSEIETQTGTLTGIQESVQSIADELTKTGELDIDKEDFEINTVIGEHIGLNEAENFVSRWTLVNQCKGLLYNVLNADRFNNSAPNFKFYYDSNKDGTKEVYTALDLSFLDNTLTNDNLVDKSRFQNPMTVRQFIQFLMIFICYFAFVIKLLRKLPGLVSGGESAESVGLDYQKIQRDQIS